MTDRILIVDDDADALEVYRTRLEHTGYEVEAAESAEDALARVARFSPAVILTDFRMPGMSGIELLERIRSDAQGVDVIVMTGHQDMESAVAAMKAGAFDYIVKPVEVGVLIDVITRCLHEQRLAEAAPPVPEGEPPPRGSLIGRDPRMVEIYKTIGMLARNRATVLIRGETGTGKEVIARAIHEHSAHAEEPFIAVNCSALTDTLLESELFGHVKGAFTGAAFSRKGYFELAGGGTIFLDEIGDTSPEFQTKLLRVVQDREFYPVGGEAARRTEARVIAATHQPIEGLVAAGRFRKDLYFRLRVVEIRVTPLRERTDDIPRLVEMLLARIREATGRDIRSVSDEAMERLRAYPWPGNVRELENALMRAVVRVRGSVIGAEHLSLGAVAGGTGEDLTLAGAVRRHVRRVLERMGGDEAAAARALGVGLEEVREHLGTDGAGDEASGGR